MAVSTNAAFPAQYTNTHLVTMAETDLAGNWRVESALLLMQEFAGFHAHQFHCGRPDLIKHGIVWMIAQAELSFTRWPRQYETITVTTWPEASPAISSCRYFVFQGEDGQTIGKAASLWILVDINSRRIVPFSKTELVFPDTAALQPPMPTPAKLRLSLAGRQSTYSRRLVYSDIDANRHLNNARYAGFVCDLFPPERFEAAALSSFSVRYCAEAAPGETLHMALYETDGGGFEVRGTAESDGRVVFEAAGQWSKQQYKGE